MQPAVRPAVRSGPQATIPAGPHHCPFSVASGNPGVPSPGPRTLLSSGCQLPASGVAGGALGRRGHSSVREGPISGPPLTSPSVLGGPCRSSLPTLPGLPSQMSWSLSMGPRNLYLKKCYPGSPEAGQNWPTVFLSLSPLGYSRISKARSQRWSSASVTQMVAAELA